MVRAIPGCFAGSRLSAKFSMANFVRAGKCLPGRGGGCYPIPLSRADKPSCISAALASAALSRLLERIFRCDLRCVVLRLGAVI